MAVASDFMIIIIIIIIIIIFNTGENWKQVAVGELTNAI